SPRSTPSSKLPGQSNTPQRRARAERCYSRSATGELGWPAHGVRRGSLAWRATATFGESRPPEEKSPPPYAFHLQPVTFLRVHSSCRIPLPHGVSCSG